MPANGKSQQATFTTTALRLGVIKPPQVQECRRIQATMESLGIEEDLSRILMKKGYLDQPKFRRVLKAMGVEQGVIPGFQLIAKVGQGGMATVYKAKQASVDRIVALKILAGFASKDEIYIRRFLQEARTAAKLNHRNVVTVFDAGVYGDKYFLVMEYVDGRTIREILNKGNLSPRKVAEILVQVTDALAYLHANRLVHRDVKPENIMLTKDGIAKLADFGLAKSVQLVKADQNLTGSGCIMGTPFYMSPEQIRGHRAIDIRSDLYSLGCTLYAMLTRRPPFEGRTPVITMQMHLKEPAPDPRERNPAVPPELTQIVHKMLEKDPQQRYQSPGALKEDLVAFLRGRPAQLARKHAAVEAVRKARRRRPVEKSRGSTAALIVIMTIMLAASGLYLFSQVTQRERPPSGNELKRRNVTAARALLADAEEDFRASRWTQAHGRFERLLTIYGRLPEIGQRTSDISTAIAACERQATEASEARRVLLNEARRFEESGRWDDARAKYELALARSESDAEKIRPAIDRCRRESEADQISGSLKEAFNESKWATSLSLSKFMKDKFADTQTFARDAKVILEAETTAADEQKAEQALTRGRAALQSEEWLTLSGCLEELSIEYGATRTARAKGEEILALREAWNGANQDQANRAAETALSTADANYARKEWLEAKVLYHRFLREFGETPLGRDRTNYAHAQIQLCKEARVGVREQEARDVLERLRDRYGAGLWEEALDAADTLADTYGDTQVFAQTKGEILNRKVDCTARRVNEVFFEDMFEGPFKGWQPESQKKPYPSAAPTTESRQGERACRLSFTGPGGNFHRLVYPVDSIDPRASRITFWARATNAPANRAPLVMVVLRESSPNGTEQFTKEITLTVEWQFISIELSSFRRTWGTKETNGSLEVDRVTGLGFEPLPTSQSLEILLDAVRIVAPR